MGVLSILSIIKNYYQKAMITKFKIILTTLVLFIIFSSLKGMDELNTTDSVFFILKSEGIYKKQGNFIKVPALIVNKSDFRYILYAFFKIEEGITTDSKYCDGDVTMGTAIILEKQGRQIFGFFPFVDDFEHRVTWEDVERVFNEEKQSVIDKKLVLEPNDTVKTELTLSLEHFIDLTPGIYELKLVYYCGKNLENMVEPNKQIADCKKYNATVFNGCLVTNKIKVEVK